MNTQKIIIGIVVIAIIGIAGWVVLHKPAEDMAKTEVEHSLDTSETASDDMSGLGTLQQLMERGESVICDFTYNDDTDTSSSGTFYFDAGRFRVDSEMMDGSERFASHIIFDGTMTYVWTAGDNDTFAFQFEGDQSETEASQYPVQEGDGTVSMDDQVTYDCNSWRAEASAFVPPADIEFMDMEAMFQNSFGNFPVVE